MIYVLDTNAVSALMKGTAAVVERLAATAPADVAVPQPVLAEIAFGIERLPRSKRRAALQARFDLISAELPRAEWTDAVSQMFGRIKATLERRGTRIEDFDAAIAAHALALDATLVTANVDHMIRVPGYASRTGALSSARRESTSGSSGCDSRRLGSLLLPRVGSPFGPVRAHALRYRLSLLQCQPPAFTSALR